ncbi:peptidase T4 [Acetobacter tropicalis]|uniref:Peptidase T4 n=2 Tax=Acetobacter tropicalis TaxID=104102 RepID=A0A149TQS3_9PROT|nr:peptidase T4 [Acetobacter tropicalis]
MERRIQMSGSLTDITGITVGHAQDLARRTGVSVIRFSKPAVASISVLGGAPAVRDTALLEPEMMVERIHAIVLSGGSVYGLDAASGVQTVLRKEFESLPSLDSKIRVPIVVQASLFDLANGGDKTWQTSPYAQLGEEAAYAASGQAVPQGTIGVGTGATTSTLRGGAGSTSMVTSHGYTVSAFIAVNAIGSATVGKGPYFWSAPFEQAREFGGLGAAPTSAEDALRLSIKPDYVAGTTIGVVATNATLTPIQAKRLAILGQDGVARGVFPAHLPQDGDTIFGVSTEEKPAPELNAFCEILQAATIVTARAIALGVYHAAALGWDRCVPSWQEQFAGEYQANAKERA